MASPGWFDAEIVGAGWFDDEVQGVGWFDPALLGTASGPTDYSGTGALAVSASISAGRVGSLVIPYAKNAARLTWASAALSGFVTETVSDFAGTGALAVAYALSGSGNLVHQNLTGTGALSVRSAISGSGTSTGVVAQPEGTQKPAGGSTPRRRRIIEDDEESEQHETAEEVIERLLEASKAQATPQRRVIRRLAKAAESALEAPAMLPQVVAATDAVMARMDALAADRYLTDLILLRRLLDQIAADIAEEDDEEALLLLL